MSRPGGGGGRPVPRPRAGDRAPARCFAAGNGSGLVGGLGEVLALERLLGRRLAGGRRAGPARHGLLVGLHEASAPHEGANWRPIRPHTRRLARTTRYPLDRYVRVFQTSGTTGPPIRWLETEASWTWWARCWASCSGSGAGAGRPPLLPVLVRPLRRLLGRARGRADPRRDGHPGGGQDSPTRLHAIRDLGATALVCTPSYGLHLAEVGARAGPRPRRARRPHHGPRGRAGAGSRPCAVASSRFGEPEPTIMRA